MGDDLPGVQVVGVARVIVGVIEDGHVEAQHVPVKRPPDVLGERGRVGAVEDGASITFDHVEQRLDCWVVGGRQSRHPVGSDGQGGKRRDLVDGQIQAITHGRVEQSVGTQIRLQEARGSPHRRG